jgi:DNA-binding GntR family transcriptional regulator
MPAPQTDQDRVIETIQARIRSGEYPPSEALPSITELADEFDVSTATIKICHRILRIMGWTVGVPGKGVYPASPYPCQPDEPLA